MAVRNSWIKTLSCQPQKVSRDTHTHTYTYTLHTLKVLRRSLPPIRNVSKKSDEIAFCFFFRVYVRKTGWHMLDTMSRVPSLNRHLCRRRAIPRAAGTRRAGRRQQQPGWSRSDCKNEKIRPPGLGALLRFRWLAPALLLLAQAAPPGFHRKHETCASRN